MHLRARLSSPVCLGWLSLAVAACASSGGGGTRVPEAGSAGTPASDPTPPAGIDAVPAMKDASNPSPVIDGTPPVKDAAGEPPGPPQNVDARVDAGVEAGPSGGSLDVAWIHGSPSCAGNTDPPIQVHRFDADTFVLRQNKCVNFEGPFIYVLFGEQKVLVEDTGATADPARFPIAMTVRNLISRRLAERGQARIDLVVAHSHAHGDHVAGDRQFVGQPDTTVVGPGLAAVQSFFQITSWPTQTVTFELGGRTLDIIPIPGHEAAHIAIHDRRTGWLLTGDSIYPGRLYVRDWTAYRASIARLAAFSRTKPISLVLGTHIEMTDAPGIDYPAGTTFQPREHVLPLGVRHLDELNEALTRIGNSPRRDVHPDFIISPL
jgi:hydroxyacylglutathione hydrolase